MNFKIFSLKTIQHTDYKSFSYIRKMNVKSGPTIQGALNSVPVVESNKRSTTIST